MHMSLVVDVLGVNLDDLAADATEFGYAYDCYGNNP